MSTDGKKKGKEGAQLHKGHRTRLRERFLKEGLEGFQDHQVLELLLFYALPRKDTNEIAHGLIRRFGSLSAVLEASPADLARAEGMGEGAGVFLSLMPPLTRRYLHERATRDNPRLNDPVKLEAYLIPLMAGRTEEVFYLICLDNACRVIYPEMIGQGDIGAIAISVRQVVEAAIRHRASFVVLTHNHPSGRCAPTVRDMELTRIIVQALGPLDIQVLDHMIVAGETCYSMAAEKILPPYRSPGEY